MGVHRCFACEENNPDRIVNISGDGWTLQFVERFAAVPGRAQGGIAIGALTCPALRLAGQQGMLHPVPLQVTGRLIRPVPLGKPLRCRVDPADGSSRVLVHEDSNVILDGLVKVADLQTEPVSILPEAPPERTEDLKVLAELAGVEIDGPTISTHWRQSYEAAGLPVLRHKCFGCSEGEGTLKLRLRIARRGIIWARWEPEPVFSDGNGRLAATIIASALDCATLHAVNADEPEFLARHADIVLPCTTPMERNDIVSGLFDNMILASRQVAAPFGEARNDHDIFAALAERLGFRDAFTENRTEMEWLRHLYETTRRQMQERGTTLPQFEAFWEAGYVENPPLPKPVMLAALRADPGANPLKTPSGKVEIYSETIASFGYDDCPGHAIWLEPAEWLGSPLTERYPLHLISNQPRTRLHSQLDNGVTSLESKIKGREPVTMHPQDAAVRGLRDGDIVRVFNERGACLAGLIVSDGVRPGVIQLATGAWYDPQHTGEGASMDKHGNPNMLTIDKGTSKLAQGPIAHTALVEVERFAGELPPITVHQAPATAPLL